MLPLAVFFGEMFNTVDLWPLPLFSPVVAAVVAGALFVAAAAVTVVPGEGTRCTLREYNYS